MFREIFKSSLFSLSVLRARCGNTRTPAGESGGRPGSWATHDPVWGTGGLWTSLGGLLGQHPRAARFSAGQRKAAVESGGEGWGFTRCSCQRRQRLVAAVEAAAAVATATALKGYVCMYCVVWDCRVTGERVWLWQFVIIVGFVSSSSSSSSSSV